MRSSDVETGGQITVGVDRPGVGQLVGDDRVLVDEVNSRLRRVNRPTAPARILAARDSELRSWVNAGITQLAHRIAVFIETGLVERNEGGPGRWGRYGALDQDRNSVLSPSTSDANTAEVLLDQRVTAADFPPDLQTGRHGEETESHHSEFLERPEESPLQPDGGVHGVELSASPSAHMNSGELLQSLFDRARQVRQDREQSGRRALAEERFGPDPFGLRDLAEAPSQLRGVRWDEVSTDRLVGHFRMLDLAAARLGVRPEPEEIWTEDATVQRDWWWPGERPSGSTPLPELPERLEMPRIVHTIWLGGPVTDGRSVTDDLRGNLEVLSAKAQEQGLRVVLWTDVTRGQFAYSTGDVADMSRWAQRHGITLLNPDEVFHVDEPMVLAAEFQLETAKGTAGAYGAASDILRVEVLYRFGGIYTDGDNEVHRLDGLRGLLRAPGFAVHGEFTDGDAHFIANSALLAARGHPFMKLFLETLAANYGKRQDELGAGNHNVGNSLEEHLAHYIPGAMSARRRSTVERTGPFNLVTVAAALGLPPELLPHFPNDRLEIGHAMSWLSTTLGSTRPSRRPGSCSTRSVG